MVLPDWMIEKLAFITPMAPGEQRQGVISYGLTSYGYDARVGPKNLKVFSGINAREIDPKEFDPALLVEPKIYNKGKGDFFWIPPHGFALCETIEEFDIPREYVCIVLGKSTYARTGLIVNVTPGEPEWKGIWTVELSNTTELPIRVYLNEGIMQCMFFKGEACCRTSYKDKKGKYQDQSGVTLPKVINLDPAFIHNDLNFQVRPIGEPNAIELVKDLTNKLDQGQKEFNSELNKILTDQNSTDFQKVQALKDFAVSLARKVKFDEAPITVVKLSGKNMSEVEKAASWNEYQAAIKKEKEAK